MNYHIRMTQAAEKDIRRNHEWWSENRSVEQADKWLIGIDKLIYSLCETADRHHPVRESRLRERGVKQAHYGTSKKYTHRVVCEILGDTVIVYRVQAFKQDAIGVDDLSGED